MKYSRIDKNWLLRCKIHLEFIGNKNAVPKKKSKKIEKNPKEIKTQKKLFLEYLKWKLWKQKGNCSQNQEENMKFKSYRCLMHIIGGKSNRVKSSYSPLFLMLDNFTLSNRCVWSCKQFLLRVLIMLCFGVLSLSGHATTGYLNSTSYMH